VNIRKKLFFLILAITVPIIVFGGALNYFLLETYITQSTLNELNVIASLQKERINDAIDRNFERLHVITSKIQLSQDLINYNQYPNPGDLNMIKDILDNALRSVSDFETIVILDKNNNIIFSSNKLNSFDSIQNEIREIGRNSDHLSFGYHNNNVRIFLSGPLILNGDYIATVVIVALPDSIINVTNNYTGLGMTGESFLAMRNQNDDALFLTSLRFDPNAQLTRVVSSTQQNVPITRALLKQETSFTDTIDYRGVSVLSSSKYLEKTDWGLVVKIDKDEAFEALKSLQFILVLSIVVLVIVSVIISFLFASGISRPIQQLRNATKEIAKGNFTNSILSNGNDEISQLALDIKEMESNLQILQQNMIKNERTNTIGELSSRLAHDMRNPLTVISTLVKILLEQNKNNLSETDLQRLNRIQFAVNRLEHQINNMLNFVKGAPLKKEPSSMSKIISNSLNLMVIPQTVNVIKPSTDVELNCDSFKIEIVFMNLIKNSLESMNDSGTITINMIKDNDFVRIDFIDSGSGIDDENLSTIFEPMFTTKSEGTGLGLLSCKSIIEQHGGTITVKNKPTTFSILLPIS
jgi:signal transduction histidine kinase